MILSPKYSVPVLNKIFPNIMFYILSALVSASVLEFIFTLQNTIRYIWDKHTEAFIYFNENSVVSAKALLSSLCSFDWLLYLIFWKDNFITLFFNWLRKTSRLGGTFEDMQVEFREKKGFYWTRLWYCFWENIFFFKWEQN